MTTVGIVLVEKNRLFREGLRRILPQSRFSILAEVNAPADILPVLESAANSLSLAIYSPSDWTADEFETIKEITTRYSKPTWIVLAPTQDPGLLKMAINCGVSGILSKDISPEALRNCLELILLDEHIFPSSAIFLDRDMVSPQMVGAPVNDMERAPPHLSQNQKTALACLMRGASNKAIAREMGIAEATVKVHLKALMKKLNANNRTQVAILGLRSAQNGSGSHQASS
jgi:two-component system nitrate/nitrite response regulator NarL